MGVSEGLCGVLMRGDGSATVISQRLRATDDGPPPPFDV
jgi:hypothetical protein